MIGVNRSRSASAAVQGHGPVEVRFRKVRINLHRLLEVGKGFLESAAIRLYLADRQMGSLV